MRRLLAPHRSRLGSLLVIAGLLGLAACSAQKPARLADPEAAAAQAAEAPPPTGAEDTAAGSDTGAATVEPKQETPATEEEAEAPETAAPAQDAAEEEPEREWLTDEEGRQFYLEPIPRVENTYRWIDETRIHVLGAYAKVVDFDDEWFYIKVYRKPADSKNPRQTRELTPEEREEILSTYRVETETVDRLHFTPFDEGLPRRGQWRNGFEIADINGDGDLDIVHGPPRKGGSWPAIFLGDGEGHWRPWQEVSFPAGYDYGDVATADFNGDGHLDLALGIHLRGVRVLVNDGEGHFTEWTEGTDYEVPGAGGSGDGFASRALTAVDWDGDGRPDLVASGEGPHPKSPLRGTQRVGPMSSVMFIIFGPVIYLNQGDGTWLKHSQDRNESEIYGDDVALGDFDGDGATDFATASSKMGRTDLVNLKGEGVSWEPQPIPEVRPWAYVRSVSAADFDGDGRDDLAVAYLAYQLETWRNGIDILYSRPGNTWERRPVFVREGRVALYALSHGDLDGDGALDLVAIDADGGVHVWLGDGEGGFVREESPELDQPRGRCRGFHVEIADLNGDGRDEVVTAFADEASAYFDPTRCPNGGGLAAWTVDLP